MTHNLSSAVRSFLSRQVPRYTSYPTAPHFYTMPPGTHKSWLESIPENAPISLYLHVPYCSKLCWFCGCSTRITQQYAPVSHYLESLKQEIIQVAALLRRRQPVLHLHLGGGSPSMLTPDDFHHVMQTLRARFNFLPDAQLAIELDPRGLDDGRIAAYADNGINRISFGVQDFDERVQRAINRIQPYEMVEGVLSRCRQKGLNQVNLDLIYGLPEQTIDSLLDTVEKAITLAPGRIALFGYAHVPWKKKNMNLIEPNNLPDESARYAMFAAASGRLKQAGYIAIGLDHFARPDDTLAIAQQQGTLKRNFQGYTVEEAHYLIGFGASSISHFPQGYAQNAIQPEVYAAAVARNELPTQRGFSLSQDDRCRRAIIEALMCNGRVELESEWHDIHIGEALKPLLEVGLAGRIGNKLLVNPDYPQAARLVCAAFDRYFEQVESRHTHAA